MNAAAAKKPENGSRRFLWGVAAGIVLLAIPATYVIAGTLATHTEQIKRLDELRTEDMARDKVERAELLKMFEAVRSEIAKERESRKDDRQELHSILMDILKEVRER